MLTQGVGKIKLPLSFTFWPWLSRKILGSSWQYIVLLP